MTDTLKHSRATSAISLAAGVRSSRVSKGDLTFTCISDRTFITRLAAQSPMKILTPSHHGRAATAMISTFGGGLVSGDHLKLSVELECGARAVIGTQSTTKVYKCVDGLGCGQDLIATLAPQSILMVLPDPIMCFAGSRYCQRQRFYMPAEDQNVGLCLIDWMVSGRRARGECWAFDSYLSHNEIVVEDRVVLQDSLRLTQLEGPLNHARRLGRYHCLATLVLMGAPMRNAASAILAELHQQPVVRHAAVVAAASPLVDGVIIRVAGVETQAVAQQLRQWCRFTCDLIGDDPWARKW